MTGLRLKTASLADDSLADVGQSEDRKYGTKVIYCGSDQDSGSVDDGDMMGWRLGGMGWGGGVERWEAWKDQEGCWESVSSPREAWSINEVQNVITRLDKPKLAG